MRQSDPSSEGDAQHFDFDSLLQPAQAFGHPCEVVGDADLTLNEKRAILASWASDACAVEASPGLRQVPGGGNTVSIDDILEALRALDQRAHGLDFAWARRQKRRGLIEKARAQRRDWDGGAGRTALY